MLSNSRSRRPRRLGYAAAGSAAALLTAVGVSSSTAPARTHVLGEQLPGSGTSATLATPATCTSGFCISGGISNLYPGEATKLQVTVANPNPVAVTVTEVDVVASDPDPGNCPVDNLSVTNFTGSPTFTVPPGSSGNLSLPATLAANAPIGCEGMNWTLTYSGSAGSNGTVPTATSVASSANPAVIGQTVTFTAVVTPPTGDPTPTGSVTFKDAGTALGPPVSVNSSGQAQFSTNSLSSGTHPITASYTSDAAKGYYTSPASATLSQVVMASCVAPPAHPTATIPGTYPIRYQGSYEVRSGRSLWLNGGTINGNVTVDSGAQFASSGGSITGSVSSAGTALLQGTTVGGSVTTSAGGLALGRGTRVNGTVLANGGGPFCSLGTSLASSPVEIGGNLQVQNLTAASRMANVCGTKVRRDLTWQNNASPLGLGTCAANSVGGNLSVQRNSGTVTVGASGAGNSASGDISVQSNTGGGTMSYNSAKGNCTLQKDTPPITGSVTNTAGKKNNCTTSG